MTFGVTYAYDVENRLSGAVVKVYGHPANHPEHTHCIDVRMVNLS